MFTAESYETRYLVDINVVFDDNSISTDLLDEIFFKTAEIYDRDVGVHLKFNVLNHCDMSQYEIENIKQVEGLFRMRFFKNGYFTPAHNGAILMVSTIPLAKTNKKDQPASYNTDETDGFSSIMCNYWNYRNQEELATKQKIQVTAHEICHHIGGSHTPMRFPRDKHSIMYKGIAPEDTLLLRFSKRSKKDMRKYLKKHFRPIAFD